MDASKLHRSGVSSHAHSGHRRARSPNLPVRGPLDSRRRSHHEHRGRNDRRGVGREAGHRLRLLVGRPFRAKRSHPRTIGSASSQFLRFCCLPLRKRSRVRKRARSRGSGRTSAIGKTFSAGSRTTRWWTGTSRVSAISSHGRIPPLQPAAPEIQPAAAFAVARLSEALARTIRRAVKRCSALAGASPAWGNCRCAPVATEAVRRVTDLLKPSGHRPALGGSASRRAATRVKPEQASKGKS